MALTKTPTPLNVFFARAPESEAFRPTDKAQAPPTNHNQPTPTMPDSPKPETTEHQTAQAVAPAAICSALEWEKIAGWLYAILDDIDTASDHAKGDDAKYRECVERLQRLRGEVGASFDGQTLTWRNPPEEYGLTRLWHPCTPTPWPNDQVSNSHPDKTL